MSKLFDRKIQIVVGNLDISNLDCNFSFDKTDKPASNSGQISVYNLSEKNRKEFELLKDKVKIQKTPIEIRAGYKDNVQTIFKGTLNNLKHTNEGNSILTEINLIDGKFDNKSIIKGNFIKETNIADIIEKLAKQLKVGIGNLDAIKSKITGKLGGANSFFGYAYIVLPMICKTAGFSWFIEDNEQKFVPIKDKINITVPKIDQGSGLVGSPAVNDDKSIEFKSLINHDIKLGGVVNIQSKFINGNFKVKDIKYIGSNYTNDFYIECKGAVI